MVAANTPTSSSEHSGEYLPDTDHNRPAASTQPSHVPCSLSASISPAAPTNLIAILGFDGKATRHGLTAAGVVQAPPGSSVFSQQGNATGPSAAKDESVSTGVAVAERGGGESGARQDPGWVRDRNRPGDHLDNMGARAYDHQERDRDRPVFPSIDLVRSAREPNGVAPNHRDGAFGYNRTQEHDGAFREAEQRDLYHPDTHSSSAADASFRDSHARRHQAGLGASFYPRHVHPYYHPLAWHQEPIHQDGQHASYGPPYQNHSWHGYPSGPFPQHKGNLDDRFQHRPPPALPPQALPNQQQHEAQQQAPTHPAPVPHTWPSSAPSSGSNSRDLINVQSPPPAGSVPFPSPPRPSNTQDFDASHAIPDSHQGTERQNQHTLHSPAHPSAWPSHPYYHHHQYPQPYYGMDVAGWEHNGHWHPPPPQSLYTARSAQAFDSHRLPPVCAVGVSSQLMASKVDHFTASTSSKVASDSSQNANCSATKQLDSTPSDGELRDATNGHGVGTEKPDAVQNPSLQAHCDIRPLDEEIMAPQSSMTPAQRYHSIASHGPWPSSPTYNRVNDMPDAWNSHHPRDPSAYYPWHGPPFHPPPHRHGYSPIGPPSPSAAATAAAVAVSDVDASPSGIRSEETVFDPITQATLDEFFPATPSRPNAAAGPHSAADDSSYQPIPGRRTIPPFASANGAHGHFATPSRQPPVVPGPPAPTIGCAYRDPHHHAHYPYPGSLYPPALPHATNSYFPPMYYPPPPPPPPFAPSFTHPPGAYPMSAPFGADSPEDYEPPHHPPHASVGSDQQPEPVAPLHALRPRIGRRSSASKVSGGATRKVPKSASPTGSGAKSKQSAAAAVAASSATTGSSSGESDQLDEDDDEADVDGETSDTGGGRRRRPSTKRRPRKQSADQVGSSLFIRGKPVDGGQSRSYLVFTREAYAKMVKCLQLAAQGSADVFSSVELRKEWKDVAASSSVRKRWKRLQFNLQVVPERQEYRQLAWRSSTLIIAPREDWDDILRQAHHSDLPPEQHASVRQTIMSIREKYETRRSRCGITAEAIDSFCHRCECYRRLLNGIANGFDSNNRRTTGNAQVQVQSAARDEQDEKMSADDDEEEDD